MLQDKVPVLAGLIVEKLAEFFDPSHNAPLGGGTQIVHVIAGEYPIAPAWGGEDGECDCNDPFIWVRVQSRFRTKDFPVPLVRQTDCSSTAVTIEVGVARCAPDDLTPEQQEKQAFVQWDDAFRLDLALCAAMGVARNQGVALNTALNPGEPFGPEGLIIAWLQTVTAQF